MGNKEQQTFTVIFKPWNRETLAKGKVLLLSSEEIADREKRMTKREPHLHFYLFY